jgi:hypothetical protein
MLNFECKCLRIPHIKAILLIQLCSGPENIPFNVKRGKPAAENILARDLGPFEKLKKNWTPAPRVFMIVMKYGPIIL